MGKQNKIYMGEFKCWDDVQTAYKTSFPEPDDVFLALYDYGEVEGYSVLIYKDNGFYYLNVADVNIMSPLSSQFRPIKYESVELLIRHILRRGLKIYLPLKILTTIFARLNKLL